MFGRNLPDNTVKELIEKGQTQSKVKGFISRSGKKYDAYLVMNFFQMRGNINPEMSHLNFEN